MKIESFEDIEAWKEARNLVREVYCLFSSNKDFGFRDQIQRASISVMTNIAEGFDRGTNKEFCQFLVIARGSASEVKSLAYAAMDLKYVDQIAFESINAKCHKLSNLINGFIRYLKNSERTK
ncbi:MAG: four helix bundle protein [Geobacteraceae bacterium]|nr:four helix bundle protein [Geobacteraceae bacterium]